MNLRLRADAYNVFNIVSLNPPVGNGATVGSSTFGVITSASAMRQLQLGLRFTFWNVPGIPGFRGTGLLREGTGRSKDSFALVSCSGIGSQLVDEFRTRPRRSCL
jgi:hypothetical protein